MCLNLYSYLFIVHCLTFHPKTMDVPDLHRIRLVPIFQPTRISVHQLLPPLVLRATVRRHLRPEVQRRSLAKLHRSDQQVKNVQNQFFFNSVLYPGVNPIRLKIIEK